MSSNSSSLFADLSPPVASTCAHVFAGRASRSLLEPTSSSASAESESRRSAPVSPGVFSPDDNLASILSSPLLRDIDDIDDDVRQYMIGRPDLRHWSTLVESHLRLTTFKDPEGTTTEKVLRVTLKDGSTRPANSIFEWVQQLCVEQMALRMALRERGIAMPEDETSIDARLPCCLVARDQGIDIPTIGYCGWWWTLWSLGLKEEKRLVEAHKNAVHAYRTAREAVNAHDPTGTVWKLVEPLVKAPTFQEIVASSNFPCSKDTVARFLVTVMDDFITPENYTPRIFLKKNPVSEYREAFLECSDEDDEDDFWRVGAYMLSTSSAFDAMRVCCDHMACDGHLMIPSYVGKVRLALEFPESGIDSDHYRGWKVVARGKVKGRSTYRGGMSPSDDDDEDIVEAPLSDDDEDEEHDDEPNNIPA